MPRSPILLAPEDSWARGSILVKHAVNACANAAHQGKGVSHMDYRCQDVVSRLGRIVMKAYRRDEGFWYLPDIAHLGRDL